MEELDAWRRDIWKSVLPHHFGRIDEVYMFWKEERKRRLTLSKEVQAMLHNLRNRYKIAILTNGPSVAQWEKLNNIGIRKYCSNFVVSGDFQVEKPHKEIFDILCRKLKVSPSKCVMIGDRLDTDILGAQKAGFGATVLVTTRDNETNLSTSIIPDYVVKDVTELEFLAI